MTSVLNAVAFPLVPVRLLNLLSARNLNVKYQYNLQYLFTCFSSVLTLKMIPLQCDLQSKQLHKLLSFARAGNLLNSCVKIFLCSSAHMKT